MIRRLSGVIGAVAVAAVLTMTASPAGAAGADLTGGSSSVGTSPRAAATWTITGHSCVGGNPHQARIKVKQQENGRSGVNYFRQVGQGQVFRNGAWQNDTPAKFVQSAQFPNDTRNFIYTPAPWVYSYSTAYNLYHRILVKLQYWNNGGTPNNRADDFVVYSAAVYNRCPA